MTAQATTTERPGAARTSIRDAVNDALRVQMQADRRTVLLGEDIGALGGVFGTTRGLLDEFGSDRVIELEAGEEAAVGAAIGMALYGLRPVVEIQFADFVFPAFDAIVNELAKVRYRTGGAQTCPMVIRAPYGAGINGGPYHSQSPEAHFVHTPGLKVVIPSNAADAKGLLLAAMKDEDPVVFLEPKSIYHGPAMEVPEGDHTVELGRAARLREGGHVTLVAYGAMVGPAMDAAEAVAADGIEAEVLDLRSLMPLDEGAVLESVARTGRLVIVHEAPRTGGFAGELSALVAEKGILHLEAPILRVTGFDTPVPYALENEYRPDTSRIAAALREAVGF